jgi:ABC-2 type transport system permease protein
MTTTATTAAVGDCLTMVRRQIKHIRRYPAPILTYTALPVAFLLLFVYVLGGAMGPAVAGNRAEFVAYLVPGIMATTIAGAAQGTTTSVATDMTTGIIARFKTMPIARVSLLAGHVLGSLVQTFLAIIATTAAALAIGYRPQATALDWLGVIAVLTAFTFAITWLAVALALLSDNVATASNLPMPLLILPFLGGGFVPTASMPTALRFFAEHQPFTPAIESLRTLLTGHAAESSLATTAAWSAAIALAGYLWARKLYNR